jgi:hypothetical protein
MSATMSTRIAAGVTADYLRDLTRRATPTPRARRDADWRRDTAMSISTPKRLGDRERVGGGRGPRHTAAEGMALG